MGPIDVNGLGRHIDKRLIQAIERMLGGKAYGQDLCAEINLMQLLIDLGFHLVRVRHHGTVARIELAPGEFPKLLGDDVRGRVDRELKALGFAYVALDIAGYRSGSMNATLE